ncbi:MAG: 30S ribosomal protein S20 [Candidatus Kerfeldbacteria bacterium]|nr:30S ribosomal protein S20 [Candidatus Kerfeldbacteria bacterium]
MPVTRAASKSLRQNQQARRRNVAARGQLKKLQLRWRKALVAKNVDQATSLAAEYSRALDKAARSHGIHRNTAARKKSRVYAALRKLAPPVG